MIHNIKKNLKETSIDILTLGKASKGILEKMKLGTKYYSLNNKSIHDYHVLRHLRENQYDICIITFPSLSLKIETIPLFINAKINIIHNYEKYHPYFNMIRNRYQYVVEIDPKAHDIDQNNNLIKKNLHLEKTRNIYPKYVKNNSDLKIKEEFINKFNINNNRKAIMIHPGSNKRNDHKRWPLISYINLAKKILSVTESKIFFIIGPDEQQLRKSIEKQKLNCLCNLHIKELMPILAASKLLITNDSGIMHLASLVRTPVITLWGATNPKRNRPIGNKNINIFNKKVQCRPCIHIIPEHPCKYKYQCIKGIEEKLVFDQVMKII
jgi:ADP-heptose:LPS heptosyltransferase